MLFFLLSFLLIFISSYFIASIFTPQKSSAKCAGFLITLGTMFAQIVLNAEILSLFSAINRRNTLIINCIFFVVALLYWIKKGKPLYIPNIRNSLKRIWTALKKDKIMMIMAFGCLFFIATAIILCILMPISSFDALCYHLNRSAFWISQGNLNHFDIADDRNLVMPINSEILYMWVLLFLKKDFGLGFFSMFGYFACIFSVYNILGYFHFSERRKLWSILILSSFASVIAEVSSLETDILIAGLILSSICLFLYALRERKLSLIYFSSLIYALAMGTKSPAIIAFPAVFLLLSYFSYKQYRKEFLKPILAFCGLLFLNFWIFSGYNYILNFIDYQNFFGSESARKIHGFRGGIKAIVANFIRYIFMLFDFSGFRYSDFVGEHITNLKLTIFNLLHIPEGLGVEMPDGNKVNNRLIDVIMGTGLLGFLLFLPSCLTAIILACIKKFSKKYSKKISAMFIFAAMFFVNLFCLSFSIAFMVFSIRFVTTLVIISSPVLALSYIKKNNIIKLMILFFVMSYFLVMSTHLSSRILPNVFAVYLQEKTITDAREYIRCSLYHGYIGKMSFCYMRDIMKKTPKGSSFGVIPNFNSRLYILKMLEKDGYKIDVILPEKIESYDLNKYDYILETDYIATSTHVIRKAKDIKMPKLNYDKDGKLFIGNNQDVSCIYFDHYEPIKPQKDKSTPTPTHISCSIPIKYYKEKGFKQVGLWNFESEIYDNSNQMSLYKKIKKTQN